MPPNNARTYRDADRDLLEVNDEISLKDRQSIDSLYDINCHSREFQTNFEILPCQSTWQYFLCKKDIFRNEDIEDGWFWSPIRILHLACSQPWKIFRGDLAETSTNSKTAKCTHTQNSQECFAGNPAENS